MNAEEFKTPDSTLVWYRNQYTAIETTITELNSYLNGSKVIISTVWEKVAEMMHICNCIEESRFFLPAWKEEYVIPGASFEKDLPLGNDLLGFMSDVNEEFNKLGIAVIKLLEDISKAKTELIEKKLLMFGVLALKEKTRRMMSTLKVRIYHLENVLFRLGIPQLFESRNNRNSHHI